MAFKNELDAKNYWRENIRLVVILMVVWFVVSFGCGVLFVDELNNIQIGGYKLGLWFAQQGSIYVFLILIFTYTHLMGKLDRKYGVGEE
ncbi:MAG: DUF4212 domain-containing protein [Cellvibrionaceae bacterium]